MADNPAPDPVQDAENLARWLFWRAQATLGGPTSITWGSLDERLRDGHRIVAEDVVSGDWRKQLDKALAHG